MVSILFISMEILMKKHFMIIWKNRYLFANKWSELIQI